IWQTTEQEIRRQRLERGIVPSFKLVDTCAAEFEAYTPYYYSAYEAGVRSQGPGVRGQEPGVSSLTPDSWLLTPEDETRPLEGKERIMILGGGPNRIGQGIEFDY